MDVEITLERSRANIYEMLALVYEKELSTEVINTLNAPWVTDAFREAGIDISDILNGRGCDELERELAVEYAGLFLGPGKHIPPYESAHRPDTDGGGLLWGKATAQIQRFVESLNLCYDKNYRDLPDHISVEFDLMKRLIEHRISSYEKSDSEGIRRASELEDYLFNEHIIKWVPQFCEKVIEQAPLGFYRDIALFTKRFILSQERKNVG